MSEPFQLLKDIDQRCRTNASALPASDSSKDEWIGIGFRVGNVELMTRMGEVSEILDPPEFTRVPGVKPWVVGIANVRGSLLPIMDLKGFVLGEGIANRKEGRILVVKHNGVNTGLIVDEVLGMRHFFLNEQTLNVPDVDKGFKPFIKLAFKRDNESWPVFSFHSLVESEQFLQASL